MVVMELLLFTDGVKGCYFALQGQGDCYYLHSDVIGLLLSVTGDCYYLHSDVIGFLLSVTG